MAGGVTGGRRGTRQTVVDVRIFGVPAHISERIPQPTASEVKAARERAGLSQDEAARRVSTAQNQPYRTWQGYEVPEGQSGHRAIPRATWELFLLLTGQHPFLQIVAATAPSA